MGSRKTKDLWDISIPKSGTEITPDDGTVYDPPFRAFYVGGTGHVKVRTVSGETIIYKNCPVGMTKDLWIDKIFAADTTATFLIGEN